MWGNVYSLSVKHARLLWPSVGALYLASENWPSDGLAARRRRPRPLIVAGMSPNRVLCQGRPAADASEIPAATESSPYLRKRQTLKQASDGLFPEHYTSRRYNTAQALNKLRPHKTEILRRWERDEDGWRELPARAWPAFQPNVEQMQEIRAKGVAVGCDERKAPAYHGNDRRSRDCQEMLFQIATAMVFYNHDPGMGLQLFRQLAENGHIDSMVACGVVLVEGLGVPPNELEGIAWLQKGVDLGSSQACYELATAYYTGIADILDEDPKMAFSLFERAAQTNHVAAMYMMADCLVEGEGVEKNVARAVPLFYKAAEKGHRFARQRIRELLAAPEYEGRQSGGRFLD